MRLLATRTASSFMALPDPVAMSTLANVIDPGLVERVERPRRPDRDLYVTSAARECASMLRSSLPDLGTGSRVGLVLATDNGDQGALYRRLADLRRQMSTAEVAAPDLFRALSYFPTGRILKAVSERLGVHGPVAAVPHDLPQARAMAKLWIGAGRADQVVVLSATPRDDQHAAQASQAGMTIAPLGQPYQSSAPAATLTTTAMTPTATATAEVWDGAASIGTGPLAAVTGYAEQIQHVDGSTCAELATEVIRQLRPVRARRSVLIVASMFADAAETLYSCLTPRDVEVPLASAMHEVAMRLGFDEVFVLTGSSGAAITGLALAQDLLGLEQYDHAVVCGVDLMHGAVARGLGMLGCPELPHLFGGAAAVRLEAARRAGGSRALLSVDALSGLPPVGHDQPFDPESLQRPSKALSAPKQVVPSGLTEGDLAIASQLAAHWWPKVPAAGRGRRRSLSADALHLIGAATSGGTAAPDSLAIVGAHALGGTGVCLISGAEPA